MPRGGRMADKILTSRWSYRGLFVGLAGVLMFARLLPLSTVAGGIPGPDVLLCLTCAWVMRRRDYVPGVLIAAVFLLQDMLMMRPPGLWALLVLLGAEFLRTRAAQTRDMPFVLEWMLVGLVMIALTLANRLVLDLAMVPQARLGLTLMHLLLTVAAYPSVVLFSRYGLGIRPMAPGNRDDRGLRP